MRKINLTLFCFFFFSSLIIGQSKNKLIFNLNKRVDSLEIIITKQNNTINQLANYFTELNKTLTNHKIEIDSLNKKVDNINLKFSKNEIKDKEFEKHLQDFSTFIETLNISQFNLHSHSQTDWYYVEKEETKNNFSILNKSDLLYKNKRILGVLIENSNVAISPFSYNKKYVACYSTAHGLYFCNLQTLGSYRLDIYQPLTWLSWSPNVDYVILGHYYEGDMTLYSYNITTNSLKELEFLKESKEDEEIIFDLESFTWVSPTEFKIKADIHCNPYGSHDCDYDGILRSYIYTYDIKQNKIINKK